MAEAVKRRGEKRTSRYVSCKRTQGQEGKRLAKGYRDNRTGYQESAIRSFSLSKRFQKILEYNSIPIYSCKHSALLDYTIVCFALLLGFSSFPTKWGQIEVCVFTHTTTAIAGPVLRNRLCVLGQKE